MAEQPKTPVKSFTTFLKGRFTYTISDASPIVEFDGQGGATLSLDGEIIVKARYKILGDIIEVVDVEGPYAIPELGVGRYKWNLTNNTITFLLVEDNSKARLKAFAVPWTKIENTSI